MEILGPTDALIVIDVQRKYVRDRGPFAVAGGAELVARISRFAHAARLRGTTLIWVTREVRPGVDVGAATRAAYGHAVADVFAGPEAELDERLGAQPGETRLVKPRQSAFFGTDLEAMLRTACVGRVVLAGVTTNICVQATAQDARARDFGVVVAGDLTASLPVTSPGFEVPAPVVQQVTLATIAHAIGTVCNAAQLVPGG